MLRNLLKVATTTSALKQFYKTQQLHDGVPVDHNTCLESVTTLKDAKDKVVITKINQAFNTGNKWTHHLVTTVEDKEKQKIARLVENTLWEHSRAYLDSEGEETKVQELSGLTPEKKCSEIQKFFQGHDLVATVFCAESTGGDFEKALLEEGHQISVRNKI